MTTNYEIYSDYSADMNENYYFADVRFTIPGDGAEYSRLRVIEMTDCAPSDLIATFGDVRAAGLEGALISESYRDSEDSESVRVDALLPAVYDALQAEYAEIEAAYYAVLAEHRADEALEEVAGEDIALWIDYSPRGFANEHDLYAVRRADLDSARKWLESLEGNPNAIWRTTDNIEIVHEWLAEGWRNEHDRERGWSVDNPACGVRSVELWPWYFAEEN